MKLASLIYATLLVLGLAMVITVSLTVGRSGSPSLPLWTAAVSPGPLSAAHGFLGTQCEACHRPVQGVDGVACRTCHATAMPMLAAKPSTAFHSAIGECAGCHVEHQGENRRPITMDHAVLAAAGQVQAAHITGPDAQARLWLLLDRSIRDLGLTSAPGSLSPAAAKRLDCSSCHVNQDPHRTLFGNGCQACHADNAWTVAVWQHPSPRSQDCVQCHQAPPSHYMMHFNMMDQTIAGQKRASVEQCFLCHQTDAWNNIRGIGWRELH